MREMIALDLCLVHVESLTTPQQSVLRQKRLLFAAVFIPFGTVWIGTSTDRPFRVRIPHAAYRVSGKRTAVNT